MTMAAPITFTCPLPADALRLQSVSAAQAISTLESIEVTLVGDKPEIGRASCRERVCLAV